MFNILGKAFGFSIADVVNLILQCFQLFLGMGQLLGEDLVTFFEHFDGIDFLFEQSL